MTSITPEDAVERNITLAFDFMAAIVDDPSLLDTIPEGATLVFLPDDDPAMVESNIQLGTDLVRRGENVYFLHVPSVAVSGQVSQ